MLKHSFFRWISETLPSQSLDVSWHVILWELVILQMQEVKCIKPRFLRSWDLTPTENVLTWQWRKKTPFEDVSPNKNGDFLVSGSLTPGVFFWTLAVQHFSQLPPRDLLEVGYRLSFHRFFVSRWWQLKDLLFSSLHPRNLTWNPKMKAWKTFFLSKWVIFRFHVSFLGCIWGNDPIWLRFFQMGWSQQIVFVVPWVKSTCEWCVSTWHRERFCIAAHLYHPRFLKTNPVWISLWQQCHCPLLTLVYFVPLQNLRKRSCHIFSDRMNWIWLKCMNIHIFCDKLPLHLGSWLWCMLRGWVASKKILLMAKNAANQLRLVVYPIIYRVLYIPGGCLWFLNHQQ